MHFELEAPASLGPLQAEALVPQILARVGLLVGIRAPGPERNTYPAAQGLSAG
jgi:hypothetical protein